MKDERFRSGKALPLVIILNIALLVKGIASKSWNRVSPNRVNLVLSAVSLLEFLCYCHLSRGSRLLCEYAGLSSK